jgi:hypothetical protein
MNWMPVPDSPDAVIAASGPYQLFVAPRLDRGWQWTVARQPSGQAQQIVATDICDSQAAAKTAAEDKLEAVRRPGRLPKVQSAMSGTERSNQRAARQAAKGVAADVMYKNLNLLQEELGSAGLTEWADRVVKISRMTALKAVAEYTRRNAKVFVTDGPRLMAPEVREQRVRLIGGIANQLDDLGDAVFNSPVNYGDFESLLHMLHKAGFWPENALVSDVAHAFIARKLSSADAGAGGAA